MRAISTHPAIKFIIADSLHIEMSGDRNCKIMFNAVINLDRIRETASQEFDIYCIGIPNIGVDLPDVVKVHMYGIEKIEITNSYIQLTCVYHSLQVDNVWYALNDPDCPDWMKAEVFMKYPRPATS